MSTKQLTKSDLVSIFIRSNFLLGSFNFERTIPRSTSAP